MSIVIRCGNPSCTNTFQAEEAAMRTNRPADFLPPTWSLVFAPLRTVGMVLSEPTHSYVCSVDCAMAYASHLHEREAIAARGTSILLH